MSARPARPHAFVAALVVAPTLAGRGGTAAGPARPERSSLPPPNAPLRARAGAITSKRAGRGPLLAALGPILAAGLAPRRSHPVS